MASIAWQFFQAGALSLALLTAYIVYRTSYDRFFHPLAKFPGPFWATVTDLWKLWILSTSESHTRGSYYHKKYGPVVRVAPNMLAVNDPKLIPTIYHRKVDNSPTYAASLLGEETVSFAMLKHDQHAARRKQLAAPFQFNNLKVAEKDMDNSLISWTNEMRDRYVKTGQRMDFANWAQWFAYDLVCKLVYGAPLGFITQGRDVNNLIAKFHSMATFAAVLGTLPWLFNPIVTYPYLKKYLRTEKRGDFLDHVLDSDMTIEQVKAECFHLMVAAPDNTAGFFCAFIRYALEDPRVYYKLMAEIEDDMPCFTAVHRETLRYAPSAPTLLPRLVSPGGCEIDGKFVPEGVEIGANPYVVHRDKEMFGEDADQFRPERWLVDEAQSREMYNHILTFGWGSRKCMGYTVAFMETYKALIHFLRLFKPTVANENGEPIWKQTAMTFMKHEDFWIRIAEREKVV